MNRARSLQPAYRWAGVAVFLIAVCFVLFQTVTLQRTSIITREPIEEHLTPQVIIVDPANRSSIDITYPEFRWTGHEEISTYTFLLLDSSGNIVWETTTTDTNLTLPQDIQLKSSQTYFWQVEGLFENGESVISEMVNFTYTTK